VIRPAELIQRKRDGEELADAEISELVLGYARGEIPDYQLAAFCMAVYFRGLSPRETYALTDAMVRSGETIDLEAEIGPSSTSTRPAAWGTRRRSSSARSWRPAASPSGR
jgi:thymidine phosphorylase